jgi:hypothetical protein
MSPFRIRLLRELEKEFTEYVMQQALRKLFKRN